MVPVSVALAYSVPPSSPRGGHTRFCNPTASMLKLRFTDRSMLWADVVHARGDRVFVPTEEVFSDGDLVTVTGGGRVA